MVFSQPLTAAELSLNQSIPASETANKKYPHRTAYKEVQRVFSFLPVCKRML